MSHREDEVELVPAEVLHLVGRGRHLRLDEFRLADPSEALAKQCFDRLDASAVIGDRDLLPEALAALGASASRPCLSHGAGRGPEQNAPIVSTSSAAVRASAGQRRQFARQRAR